MRFETIGTEGNFDNEDIEPEKENNPFQDNIDIVFLRYHRNQRNRIIFFKVLFIFLMEMGFLLFAIQALVFTGIQGPYTFYVTSLKFFCVFSVHIMQQPSVLNSIERLNFVFKHPHLFEQTTIPLMICIMKLILSLSIEVCCIFITAYNNDNITCVMDYAAMLVLNNIDIFYCQSLRDDLKKQIEMAGFQIPITNE